MKKVLFILMTVFCSKLHAQNGLPPIDLHQKDVRIYQPMTIQPYSIAAANQLANGRLVCLPNSCQSALPVKLLLFEGFRVNEELVSLKWKTTNEINNTGFEIERSLGNTNNFTKIAFVKAQSDAAPIHNYHFDDANDFSGISYYRLKQVDADGRFSYSRVIPVRGYHKSSGLSVYPNPATHTVNLSFEVRESTTATLSIYDVNGRIVFRESLALGKGQYLKQVPVEKFSAGLYWVKLEMKDRTVVTERFTKQ